MLQKAHKWLQIAEVGFERVCMSEFDHSFAKYIATVRRCRLLRSFRVFSFIWESIRRGWNVLTSNREIDSKPDYCHSYHGSVRESYGKNLHRLQAILSLFFIRRLSYLAKSLRKYSVY